MFIIRYICKIDKGFALPSCQQPANMSIAIQIASPAKPFLLMMELAGAVG